MLFGKFNFSFPLGQGSTDTTAPTCTIAVTGGSPNPNLPLPITFTLSEVSTDFAVGDVTVAGGTIANFAGSGTAYTCEGTPTATNGTMTFDVAADSFHDAAGNGNVAATQLTVVSNAYAVADEFTTDRAAGAVNGTAAEPGPGGTRAVTDSLGTKLSLSGGIAIIASHTANNDPSLNLDAITRVAGKVFIIKLNNVNGRFNAGLWRDATKTIAEDIFTIPATTLAVADLGGASSMVVSAITNGTYYDYYIVTRAAGAMYLAKGGTQFTYPTLLWAGKSSTQSPLTPGFGARLNEVRVDQMYVSSNFWLPTPLASDGMSAATTDGLGHAETTGLGSGGSGKAYTDVGTWGVAGGVRSCSVLDTGIGISTVDGGEVDVLHYVALTRSAGNVGIVVRKLNATNYVYAYHDGTNVTLRKVVAGVDSEVLAPTAATYSAGKDLCVICYGTKFRVFYNNAAVGGELTISDNDLQTGTHVGLFTSNTGNTFDNLITYARGTGGEYENFI